MGKCRYMLTVGIDVETCSGEKHALERRICPAAKLSIVTNQQGFQHTVDGWTEFGAEFGIGHYLPHVVNAYSCSQRTAHSQRAHQPRPRRHCLTSTVQGLLRVAL